METGKQCCSRGKKAKTIQEIKSEIITLLEETDLGHLPRSEIQDVMKQGKEWNYIKRFGYVGFPRGQAQNDFNDLKNLLEEIGIFLVPVGEPENFCRELGSHGAKFVTRLLSEIDLNDPALAGLREFVQTVHDGKHAPL